ncbi:hypothetical protein B0W48_09345 [Pseudoalteromonas aliena]|uniref:DUF4157 domain-containing protein n=1 Tax=Pseudoalteromonas aliena TaxID=247523 RepID=A0A1Q2GXW4_9GAMM|nr:hypothetical protein [Pseudoalteromonas aliena]AQP99971.1 hypothetical protein B0W48_09345 [Pseudoalteromonas aliena]
MKIIGKIFILVSALLFQVQATENNELSMVGLLPQYIEWAKKINQNGLVSGRALDEKELILAQEIGIHSPEKVRIVVVDLVPYPYENPALKAMGEAVGFIGDGIVSNAQAFGYSIYVRKGYDLNRSNLAHELVHVLQIERADFASVVTQHVNDLAKYGYENSPIEAEAFKANIKYAIDKN